MSNFGVKKVNAYGGLWSKFGVKRVHFCVDFGLFWHYLKNRNMSNAMRVIFASLRAGIMGYSNEVQTLLNA